MLIDGYTASLISSNKLVLYSKVWESNSRQVYTVDLLLVGMICSVRGPPRDNDAVSVVLVGLDLRNTLASMKHVRNTLDDNVHTWVGDAKACHKLRNR